MRVVVVQFYASSRGQITAGSLHHVLRVVRMHVRMNKHAWTMGITCEGMRFSANSRATILGPGTLEEKGDLGVRINKKRTS
ncbi:hypothetical protein CONPUDRAFT_86008 [Coniophora puteana RWD-64-598 SS2]|uniref:Uncharacterized protein n=1 Tax=Coniophora puteana (strain RWD-64-598) TaxID=741705 RepID=R7SD69_CONPW|nr:uncharacterized protein CONPUDRAFT_86008 [Coniophora puteana RWD-64-598 SS2]EIW74121.1 hypothetical protein CONPUDRAFT_86008 [Coniophora puteana RWD-64-598 SS2]